MNLLGGSWEWNRRGVDALGGCKWLWQVHMDNSPLPRSGFYAEGESDNPPESAVKGHGRICIRPAGHTGRHRGPIIALHRAKRPSTPTTTDIPEET